MAASADAAQRDFLGPSIVAPAALETGGTMKIELRP